MNRLRDNVALMHEARATAVAEGLDLGAAFERARARSDRAILRTTGTPAGDLWAEFGEIAARASRTAVTTTAPAPLPSVVAPPQAPVVERRAPIAKPALGLRRLAGTGDVAERAGQLRAQAGGTLSVREAVLAASVELYGTRREAERAHFAERPPMPDSDELDRRAMARLRESGLAFSEPGAYRAALLAVAAEAAG